ncbi:hypothetical protein [Luteipulveratus mongoliensis]|uniref:Uncharacterized protein n=1 Tax=Luteipulveratus mongoliensis TaxID=571913 RepID=A0A0K1JD93_9MICO|nr:hypothetical protein [Luteipulveratus mongoliensis]AKU14682.1 hypothetical protein VV02_00350 [Luteipulveratus mongoliensis]
MIVGIGRDGRGGGFTVVTLLDGLGWIDLRGRGVVAGGAPVGRSRADQVGCGIGVPRLADGAAGTGPRTDPIVDGWKVGANAPGPEEPVRLVDDGGATSLRWSDPPRVAASTPTTPPLVTTAAMAHAAIVRRPGSVKLRPTASRSQRVPSA